MDRVRISDRAEAGFDGRAAGRDITSGKDSGWLHERRPGGTEVDRPRRCAPTFYQSGFAFLRDLCGFTVTSFSNIKGGRGREAAVGRGSGVVALCRDK